MLTACLCALNVCYSQTAYENYIKNFPRKSSTVVHDYQGNVLKSKSLGVLDVRVTSVQQCADAAIRLRAEYFYSLKEYDKIMFKLTSGLAVPFAKWAVGYHVKVSGNKAVLVKSKTTNDYSRDNFEAYLKCVMNYTGSASLYRNLTHRQGLPHIGDLLVLGGYPGHVVIIIDKKVINGVSYYLFANSWMPAQDIEIISGSSTADKNVGNYVPIKGNCRITVNGYVFDSSKHLMQW